MRSQIFNSDEMRRDGYNKRILTTDNCDCCLEYIMVKKKLLSLRLRGWKFLCRDCWNKNYSEGSDPGSKGEKVWICMLRYSYEIGIEKSKKTNEQKALMNKEKKDKIAQEKRREQEEKNKLYKEKLKQAEKNIAIYDLKKAIRELNSD